MKNKGRKEGDGLVICEMDIVLGFGKRLGRSSQRIGGVGMNLYICFFFIFVCFKIIQTGLESKF